MGNKYFFEQKALFMMQHPEADQLLFLRQYTRENPAHDIGWYYYARELEVQGELKKAYIAYRKCIRIHGEYHNQAIEAMLALEKKIHRKRKWLKRLLKPLLISVITLIAVLLPIIYLSSWLNTTTLFSPTAENASIGNPSRKPLGTGSNNISGHLPWIEVVSTKLSDANRSDDLRNKLVTYWDQRIKDLGEPLMLIAVNNEKLISWTPQLFSNADKAIALVVPDLSGQPQWIDPNCSCEVSDYGDAKTYANSIIQRYEEQRSALEKWLVLRSALYHFAQKNGELPHALKELTGPFPGNYLSQVPEWKSFPFNASSQRPTPSASYFPEMADKKELWRSLEQVIPFFAINRTVPFSFEPLSIEINKATHRLTVRSGSFIIRDYDAGLGKENRTPEGTFSVVKKINQPLSKTDAYGTRALVLSDEKYAIHGTNDPASVGTFQTLGSVRLHNQDIEELYSMISLGATVQMINGKNLPAISFANPAPPFLLPAREEERDMTTYYHWLY